MIEKYDYVGIVVVCYIENETIDRMEPEIP
jgi:hypothetical protein